MRALIAVTALLLCAHTHASPATRATTAALLLAAVGANAYTCPTTRAFRDGQAPNPATGKPWPNTLLFSFEGSGNTWTRWLLENVTGIWSGAIYDDPSLRDMGFEGEGVQDNRVVVVKSHLGMCPSRTGGNLQANYQKVIHLVRNPLEALVAERKRILADHDAHVAQPPWELFLDGRVTGGDDVFILGVLTWEDWATFTLNKWKSTMQQAKKYDETKPLITVRYEDLHRDVGKELGRMLTFLELDASAAACVPETHGVTRRSSAVGYPECVYTRPQLQKLMQLLEPEFSSFNYTIPAACQGVWRGAVQGGRAAVPVGPRSSDVAEAEERYRKKKCEGGNAKWMVLCRSNATLPAGSASR